MKLTKKTFKEQRYILYFEFGVKEEDEVLRIFSENGGPYGHDGCLTSQAIMEERRRRQRAIFDAYESGAEWEGWGKFDEEFAPRLKEVMQCDIDNARRNGKTIGNAQKQDRLTLEKWLTLDLTERKKQFQAMGTFDRFTAMLCAYDGYESALSAESQKELRETAEALGRIPGRNTAERAI